MSKSFPWAVFCISLSTAAEYGIVNLDNATFPLVVGRALPVFVRFERAATYGAEHEAFLAVAQVIAKRQPKIIIAQIYVHPIPKFNIDMAKKFGFMTDGKEAFHDIVEALPKFIFFQPGDIHGAPYTGRVTKDNMLRFLGVEDLTLPLSKAPPPPPPGAEFYNMVTLDDSTLPLLAGQNVAALVRFDKEHPTLNKESPQGKKNNAFKKLAASLVGKPVLFGHAGHATARLAHKYWTSQGFQAEHDFPKFRFYAANGGEDFEYKGSVTVKDMTRFLKKRIHFGLRGGLLEFDKLAADFVKSSDKGAVLQRARQAADSISGVDKDAASYYVTVMERTHETGTNWFQKEFDKLKHMIRDDTVLPEEKNEIQLQMNRLHSFVAPHPEL